MIDTVGRIIDLSDGVLYHIVFVDVILEGNGDTIAYKSY